MPRGEKAAGVLLYDDTGQEHGGYVLAADPEAGSVVQLWHRNDAVELRSDSDGSRFTATRGFELVHAIIARAETAIRS